MIPVSATGHTSATIRALAIAGVTSEESFLKFENWPFEDRLAIVRQRKLRIEKGLLDSLEPATPEEVAKVKRDGGLLFREEIPILSLGTDEAPLGHFFCACRGRIYCAALQESHDNDKAFKAIKAPVSDYSIYRKTIEGSDEYDIPLTRAIFGLDFEAMDTLLIAYHSAFYENVEWRGPSRYSPWRVTDSRQGNRCAISGRFIPPGFPFLCFCVTTRRLGHVSFGAFLEHIEFLTFGGRPGLPGSQRLIECGATPEILGLCGRPCFGFLGDEVNYASRKKRLN